MIDGYHHTQLWCKYFIGTSVNTLTEYTEPDSLSLSDAKLDLWLEWLAEGQTFYLVSDLRGKTSAFPFYSPNQKMFQELGLELSVVPGGARYSNTLSIGGRVEVSEYIGFKWLDFHNQRDEKYCNSGCD